MGILPGYLVKWIILWKVPASLKAIMSVLIIPTVSVFVLGIIYVYLFNGPIVWLSESIIGLLGNLMQRNIILFAIFVGLVCEIDMGGAITKAVTIFSLALLAKGNIEANAIFFVCTSVPPLAILLSTYLFKDKWSQAERIQAKSAGIMGFMGITEGAIPFLVQNPLKILPGTMIGCAVASVVAALTNVGTYVPHGGFLPTPVTQNALWYVLAQVAGITVGAIILGLMKKPEVTAEASA